MGLVIVAIVTGVILTVVVLWWVFLSQTRYYMIPTGGRMYEIDRRSGRAWLFNTGDKTLLRQRPEIEPEKRKPLL